MRVKCKYSSGYYNLKVGQEYEVMELIPQLVCNHFTFPRYVCVHDGNGKTVTGHAYRFETLDGMCLEDYIKENIKDKHISDMGKKETENDN